MARPTKYTEEVVRRIEQAIEKGATYEMACAYAGISFETFRVWRDDKPAFLALVKSAEGRATVKWLSAIEAAADSGEWQAAAWKLERRYPAEFGRRSAVDLEHKGKVKHEHSGRIDLRQATDDELAVLERLAQRAALN